MIVLGYNGFNNARQYFRDRFLRSGVDRHRVLGHDAGAALFVDGRLVAAAEEERFAREKKTSRFPKSAIKYCLQEAGLSLTQVDHFAFPWSFELDSLELKQGVAQRTVHDASIIADELAGRDHIVRDFVCQFGHEVDIDRKLTLVPHHVAHLYSGYYCCGGVDAAFLISDGRAEYLSSIAGEISSGKLHAYPEFNVGVENSIGMLYSKITRYLGFTPNCDEYKVMALASYNKMKIERASVDQLIRLIGRSNYRTSVGNPLNDQADYNRTFENVFCSKPIQYIAAVAQTVVEEAIWHQVRGLEAISEMEHLIIDGGVALNCVNNSKILKKSRFKDIHVSFASNDCGVPIGAAFKVAIEQSGTSGSTHKDYAHNITPYLGPKYGRSDIDCALRAKQDLLEFIYISDNSELYATVAAELHAGSIVGWFSGRMEFGPRALGNRSLLANPAIPGMRDVLNRKIKNREAFRPFAAAILEEDVGDFFYMGKKERSPHMTFVFPVRESKRNILAEALNIDGTSRIQTVSQGENPRFFSLLSAFKQLSGHGCLINTSFNVQGEPIVERPDDAINCFLSTEIDLLVLENYVVRKI